MRPMNSPYDEPVLTRPRGSRSQEARPQETLRAPFLAANEPPVWRQAPVDPVPEPQALENDFARIWDEETLDEAEDNGFNIFGDPEIYTTSDAEEEEAGWLHSAAAGQGAQPQYRAAAAPASAGRLAAFAGSAGKAKAFGTRQVSGLQAQMNAAAAQPMPPRSLPRRDPAPSRLAYRLQRLWLTPTVRALTRFGLPVLTVALGLTIWLGNAERREALVAKYETVKTQIQNRPEFMVGLMKIEGANPEIDQAIRAMLPVKLPASSFQLDLPALQDLIGGLDAVAAVDLRIRTGGVLDVKVTERVPALLWRHANGLELLDATGHRVATLIARESRPDLPLIAGVGAENNVPEALALLSAAGPILKRARGLVRIGERRWDLVLDRNQRILLPESDPVQALERVIALDRAEDLMARDFTILDMRNEDRPTIRLSATAVEEMNKIATGATKTRASR
jgi:cell division protein FtsQ